ncbi:MAG TPA: hypothetical protein VIH27_00125 [Nitrososphaerales archaeon]
MYNTTAQLNKTKEDEHNTDSYIDYPGCTPDKVVAEFRRAAHLTVICNK